MRVTLLVAPVAVALMLTLSARTAPLVAQEQPAMMEGVMGQRPGAFRLGGHVGVVVPAIRFSDGPTTYFTDRFIFGFPVGLTLKPRGPVAVDFEFIPTFNTGDDIVVTIHPGVVYGFAGHYAVGIRAAYDAGSSNDSYGFTALISRGFSLGRGLGGFIELDVPVRRNSPTGRGNFTSAAIAAHVGIAF